MVNEVLDYMNIDLPAIESVNQLREKQQELVYNIRMITTVGLDGGLASGGI